MARLLRISPSTADKHRAHVLKKAGCETVVELVRTVLKKRGKVPGNFGQPLYAKLLATASLCRHSSPRASNPKPNRPSEFSIVMPRSRFV
jgi:hypothetical protein